MDKELVPVILIAGGLVLQYYIGNQYDYQCPNCQATFSPKPVALAIAPHRFGARKYLRCPNCRKLSWADPVRKR